MQLARPPGPFWGWMPAPLRGTAFTCLGTDPGMVTGKKAHAMPSSYSAIVAEEGFEPSISGL